ncbi:MAG TPA: glycosyltransferase [Polyangiaceae bacterium]|nr:glycosyltransferase [Polyangiaceae bacterium]
MIDRVALVVPCYNEERRLDVEAFLRGTRGTAGGRALDLVFVDDGSKDGTRAVLESVQRRAPARVHVIAYAKNQGKAEAVRRGILHALTLSPAAVGFWDADLATPLGELTSFVAVLEARGAIDIVMGSRVQLMGRHIARNPWRHYSGRLFATAASTVLGLPVYDTQCGAKLFRVTPLLPSIFAMPFVARWIFDVEILARFLSTDRRGPEHVASSLYELPLDEWIDVQGSKLRTQDFARAALDLARIRATYPMKA